MQIDVFYCHTNLPLKLPLLSEQAGPCWFPPQTHSCLLTLLGQNNDTLERSMQAVTYRSRCWGEGPWWATGRQWTGGRERASIGLRGFKGRRCEGGGRPSHHGHHCGW
eukprot:1157646-Pelagomonas_calceolata.AAC.11